jgi:hypothetical protein
MAFEVWNSEVLISETIIYFVHDLFCLFLLLPFFVCKLGCLLISDYIALVIAHLAAY